MHNRSIVLSSILSIDIASFFSFNQLIEEVQQPLNDIIRREYNLRRKDDADRRKQVYRRCFVDIYDVLFILDHRIGTHVIKEYAALIKYSQFQSLEKILYE
jgi:hypothetical protein